MEAPQQPRQPAPSADLRAQLLRDALAELVERYDPQECEDEHLDVLRRTTQVEAALRHLHLTMAPRHVAARAAPDAAQHPAAAAQQEHPAPDFAAVVGTAGCRLGVVAADLLAEELPPESARRAALAAAGPALEAALRRRCADVAAACGYASTDHSGLPDHIRQLQAAAEGQQAAQAETWRSAAEQAGEAVALLARASELLARILRQHKLATQKEANSAQAAALHAACLFFREKTASTVPVLRRIAVEVEAAVGAAAAAPPVQATARLAHYRALGPGFEALADEHGSVLEALEEAEYELREIEQFRALLSAARA